MWCLAAMSRVIVRDYGVGSYCEGKVYINNVVDGIFRRLNECLVAAVSRDIGLGDVVIVAVLVVYVVSMVI